MTGEDDMASDIEEDDSEDDSEDEFFSSTSDLSDNDSNRSFLSVLDKRRHIADVSATYSDVNPRNDYDKDYTFAQARQQSARFITSESFSLSTHPSQTQEKISRKYRRSSLLHNEDKMKYTFAEARYRSSKFITPDSFSVPSRILTQESKSRKAHRCSLACNTGTTPLSAFELSFPLISRVTHRARSEQEENFHRYIDYLEAEQLRSRPSVPGYDSDEDSMDGDGLMVQVQQQYREEKRRLSAVNESPSTLSLSSTLSTSSTHSSLALVRCKAREPHFISDDCNMTPERSVHSSPSIQSNSSYQNGHNGPWWVAVPAASESGDVWEQIDAAWIERDKKGSADEVSTFTARNEDLEDDEQDLLDGIELVSTSKGRWSRCKKALKQVFRRMK